LLPQISQNCKLFYFWNADEKNWASSHRIIERFTQKLVTELSQIWDLGSGKNLFWIPDLGSGSRGRKGTGSRIRNTGDRHTLFPAWRNKFVEKETVFGQCQVKAKFSVHIYEYTEKQGSELLGFYSMQMRLDNIAVLYLT
jgi:hypothetical protein